MKIFKTRYEKTDEYHPILTEDEWMIILGVIMYLGVIFVALYQKH